MKGVAATILRMLYVSRLQRWLLGVGLGVALLALGALAGDWYQGVQPLFGLAGVLGLTIAIIAPVVVDPLLFRSMSAPRTLALIPYGRLQLVLGAFCSQLLLAVFIGAGLGLMNAHGALHPGSTSQRTLVQAGIECVIAFGVLTLYFMVFSCVVRFKWGAFVWLPSLLAPRILTLLFPDQNPGSWIVTPTGLGTIVAASLLGWVVFAVAVVGSRPASLSVWNTVGLGSIAKRSAPTNASRLRHPVAYTPRDAIRILLTGNVIGRGMLVSVLFIGAVCIVMILANAGTQNHDRILVMWAFIACLFAGIIPGLFTGMLVRRARLLWLTTGKARAELFTTIERQCWRIIFSAFGAAMIMAVPMVALGSHAHPGVPTLLAIAVLPLSCGSALVYVGLLFVRGNRFTDLLIIAANAVYLLVVTLSAAINSHLFPLLIGIQIVLVPVVRQIARGRWNHIDWLLLKQPLAAARLP